MTRPDFTALLPILLLAGFGVLTMLTIAFHRRHETIAAMGFGGCLAAAAGLYPAAGEAPRPVTALLVVDGYALLYMGLIIGAAATVTALSYGYLKQGGEDQVEEFYLLLLLATLGAAVLTAANHFAAFFLGLELVSVSLYGLIGYARRRAKPLEAGIKYLLLSAASSGFLLFGMALIYFETGVMDFPSMAARLAGGPKPGLVMAGIAMIVAAIGFKLAVVPFHMWTPDVYEGAPAPVTAYVAAVSKGAIFALLLRYLYRLNFAEDGTVWFMFGLIAAASMITGNLLALLQDNVKRILAYSSIAHLGYLLVAFVAAGSFAVEAVTFYLVAYFVTTLGAFGVVTVLSPTGGDADTPARYRGLFWRRPWIASAFILMLLSLAGIPLTAGFIGKFYVLAAGVGRSLWWLVLLLVANSVIGLFYYLRLIVALLSAPEESFESRLVAPPLPASSGAALFALTLLLLWLGIYPAPLIALIRTMTAGFTAAVPLISS